MGLSLKPNELADIEMLLDPAEQQFDLPASFLERSDFNRGAVEIVGDESTRT